MEGEQTVANQPKGELVVVMFNYELLEMKVPDKVRSAADRIQERFVKPLVFDRLCALVAPAMTEARQSEGGRSFTRLEKELRLLTATPTGVGLDVPHWLRRLEGEIRRVRTAQTATTVMAEKFLRVPRKTLSLAELRQQLRALNSS